MDTAVLVKTERLAAWHLLAALKDKHFPMTAVFWHYLPDAEVWRLVIATILVDEIGSIAAYTKLQTLLNNLPEDISEGFLSQTSPCLAQLQLWNYCNVLRDDGPSYGDYLQQLTNLLFLKMAHERTEPPCFLPSIVPDRYD